MVGQLVSLSVDLFGWFVCRLILVAMVLIECCCVYVVFMCCALCGGICLCVAAVLGVGLVYQATAHRHIAEVLLSEIGQ